MSENFGTDLRLLRNLEHQHDRDRGRDIATVEVPGRGVDLHTHSGNDNLQQALLLRFLTYRGEMAVLGHANYGSRLAELIGELNSETNRNRAKFYVLQTLADEPRVEEVLSARVRQNLADRSRIDIDLSLRVIGSDTPLNLVFPFFLDGGGPL